MNTFHSMFDRPLSKPALSPQAVIGITEVITGGSGHGSTEKRYGIYRSGTQLETFFANCGVNFQLADQSRVRAVRDMLTRLNHQPTALDKFKRIIEAAVAPSIYPNRDDHAKAVEYLNERLRDDGLQVYESGGKYRVGTPTRLPSVHRRRNTTTAKPFGLSRYSPSCTICC